MSYGLQQNLTSNKINTIHNWQNGTIKSDKTISNNLNKITNSPNIETEIDNFLTNYLGKISTNDKQLDILDQHINTAKQMKFQCFTEHDIGKLTFIIEKFKYIQLTQSSFGNNLGKCIHIAKLADCYKDGIGVPQNFAKAKDLYNEAKSYALDKNIKEAIQIKINNCNHSLKKEILSL